MLHQEAFHIHRSVTSFDLVRRTFCPISCLLSILLLVVSNGNCPKYFHIFSHTTQRARYKYRAFWEQHVHPRRVTKTNSKQNISIYLVDKDVWGCGYNPSFDNYCTCFFVAWVASAGFSYIATVIYILSDSNETVDRPSKNGKYWQLWPSHIDWTSLTPYWYDRHWLSLQVDFMLTASDLNCACGFSSTHLNEKGFWHFYSTIAQFHFTDPTWISCCHWDELSWHRDWYIIVSKVLSQRLYICCTIS